MNTEKKIGIDLHLIIHSEERDLTTDDMTELMDRIVAFIDNKGFISGGGASLVDVNEEL